MGKQDRDRKKMGRQYVRQKNWRDEMQDKKNGETGRKTKKRGDKTQDQKK